MYRAVTHQIQVTVEPRFAEQESEPAENRYFWTYHVEIVNLGLDTVQLRSRHWRIVDANGREEHVRGRGVVGKEPVLRPGESFEYTSGCPLSTPSGIMVGDYEMEKVDGEVFRVAIPAFSLDTPNAARVLN